MIIEDVIENDEHFAAAKAARIKVLEQVADFDDNIANKYLEEQDVSAKELKTAIKKAILEKPDKLCISFSGR